MHTNYGMTLMQNLFEVEGDLLSFKEWDTIAHQCNVTSKGAKGLAKTIFDKYPITNTYNKSIIRELGKCHIFDIGDIAVINMYAQYYPGKANSEGDTGYDRLLWFESCLMDINSRIRRDEAIAFPYGIGCGLAGGQWKAYREMIENFAKFTPNNKVYIVKKEESPSSL